MCVGPFNLFVDFAQRMPRVYYIAVKKKDQNVDNNTHKELQLLKLLVVLFLDTEP